MSTLEAKVERLKAEATERWGDSWFVKTHQFADGDFRAYAASSMGQNEDGDIIEHRLFVSDEGEVAVERFVVEDHTETHEPIERSATTP